VNESGIFAIESSQLGLADWNNVRSLAEGFAVSLGLEADLGVNYYLDVEFDLPRTMARWRDLGAPKQAGLPANFVNTEAA
jgi:ferritin-like protein